MVVDVVILFIQGFWTVNQLGHRALYLTFIYAHNEVSNISDSASSTLWHSPLPLLFFTITPVTCHLFFIWLPVGNTGQHTQLRLPMWSPRAANLVGKVVKLMCIVYWSFINQLLTSWSHRGKTKVTEYHDYQELSVQNIPIPSKKYNSNQTCTCQSCTFTHT